MIESELTEIKCASVIINQTNDKLSDEVLLNHKYLEDMDHTANLAIITLRAFKPKLILVKTNSDTEFSLFETLGIDGIIVRRI